ncbi:hypothetical protein D9M68_616030 [compost metagenome]
MFRGDAQPHIAGKAGGQGAAHLARVVGQDADGADQVGPQAQRRVHALADDVGGQPGARLGLNPRVGDFRLGQPAAAVADVDLEFFGARMAGDAAHRHAIRAQLGHAGLAEVRDDIRRQIARGIVHFIQQLFLDGAGIDHAAGAVRLADDELAVGVDLGYREAGGVHVGHVLQARYAEVAARHLQAAFQHVAGHGGASQAGPVVQAPAEVGKRGAKGERGIRHAARHHDLGARGQRLRDFGRAQVGVGADHIQSVQRAGQALPQQIALRRAGQRVAVHHRDAGRGQPLLAREFGDAPGGANRVGGPEVADNADAMAQAFAEHRPDQLIQQRLIAACRVVVAGQLRQRQRALGQRFEDQRAAAARGQRAHHGRGAVAAVSGKTGGAADEQGRLRHGESGSVLEIGVRNHYRHSRMISKIERSDQFIEKSHESVCPPAARFRGPGRRKALHASGPTLPSDAAGLQRLDPAAGRQRRPAPL